MICDGVPFERPAYDRQTINAAARELLERGNNASQEAREAVENWRNSHFFPHRMFVGMLRRMAPDADAKVMVSERRKRLKSILKKLHDEPTMRFTQMQDIAGCRAVVGPLKSVYALEQAYRSSRTKHQFKTHKDYIKEPKGTGYRSLHLVYAYHSKRNDFYNDLKVELQFRSTLQHVWATAVETVGTFRGESLKSGQGNSDWLRFFALMSAYIASKEKSEPVPGTPTNAIILRKELRELVSELDVVNQLQAFTEGLNITQTFEKQPSYYVLELDVALKKLNITSYRRYAAATTNIREVETTRQASDVVVVSVSDLKLLRRAYPNYFADTKAFLHHLAIATGA